MTDIKNKNGAVAPFPFASTLEFAHQQDPREFVWLATHGLPKIRQTKLILEARAAGILDDGDTRVFIDAAGLGAI